QRIHAFRREVGLAIAQRAEVGFHFVCQHLGVAKPDHPRDTLQRMKTAKEFVDRQSIYRRLIYKTFEFEEVASNDYQMLVAFGQVVGENLGHELVIVLWFEARHDRS